MPVKDTAAKLWFKTPQEEKDYDDMMMANIELKSTDFDDPNYTILFNRSKTEKFPTISERHKNDLQKYKDILNPDADTKWRKFGQKYTKTTAWRTYSGEVGHGLGFVASYLVLRELPIRNFYARSLIMFIFATRLLEHYQIKILGFKFGNHLKIKADKWLDRKLQNFNMAYDTTAYLRNPNENGKVDEHVAWQSLQPGHVLLDKHITGSTMGRIMTSPRHVGWDGTFNMPLDGLADRSNKLSASVFFNKDK